MELLSDEGFRFDGRRAAEFRKIQGRLGVFDHADGSAILQQGNTKVLAAVFGPRQPMASQHGAVSQEKCIVDVEYSRAAFASAERKRRARGDKKAQEISLSLKKTFEATILTTLYPRSAISIFVEVLQADGGDYAVCVNAATLALIDAGIPIRDVCCAVSCGVAIKDNVAYSLLDLAYSEESARIPTIVATGMPKTGEMVFFEVESRLHMDYLRAQI
ncbi:unnamed protein product [Oikopleura dioica]|uniref:Putative exosome complex component RRP41 n=1 Tax=Oikopleura dioica TaxID=34765 RepID=E4YBM6_OIKDI|nr:unnamed protein product [Oikopleura dioica]